MMKCLVCDNQRVSVIDSVETSKRYDVAKCRNCSFVYALPRPTTEELIAHYDADYFTNSDREAGYANYYHIGEMNMRAMWPVFKDYVSLSNPAGCSILDVGCASGAFLNEAKQDGCITMGIELSEDAVRRAVDHYKLNVLHGDIFSNALSGERFDILTMWHVLEHTLEPIPVLLRAQELLKPSGRLFIELPHWNSLGRIIKGNRWKQLLPPAHLNYFTTKSMREALMRMGYEVLRCSTHYAAGFAEMHQRAPSVIRPAIRGLENAIGAVGYGAYLRALARKR